MSNEKYMLPEDELMAQAFHRADMERGARYVGGDGVRVCAECEMPVDWSAHHPYLHCVLWKATGIDPEILLAQYGYVRDDEAL